MLYTLRFRKPMGVGTTFIGPCPSHASAETLGRFWCANQSGPGFRFISVEKAVSATMDDLPLELLAGLGTRTTTTATLPVAASTTTPMPLAAISAAPTTTDQAALTAAALAGADRTVSESEPVASPLAAAAPVRKSGRIGQ